MLNRIQSNKEEAATKYVKCDFKKKVVVALAAPSMLRQAGNRRHDFGSRRLQMFSAPWRSRA